MAVAARGGADRVAGVIFHSDRGSTYTAGDFAALCAVLKVALPSIPSSSSSCSRTG